MGNPYIGRVNQQLMFARHQLQLEVDVENANERMRNQGILHAGLWHLCWAYRAYLAEVGGNYKLLKPELSSTAKELSRALEAMNKHPAEAHELERLEADGFIHDMFQALADVEQIESGLIPPAPANVSSPIALRDITDRVEKLPLSFACLSLWIESFKKIVNRHREHMIEY